MGGFFLSQAVLLSVERGLGVKRWPATAARAWTISALLLTSPLFSAPVLQVVESTPH
jgi:hypothetical protein